jgi:uncharacterized membrane protein
VELFERFGLAGGFRWLHILAGITWIGLLYYFNLVQVPAFAEYGDEGRARNIAIDKIARRALWWFRWSALTTAVLGLLITGVTEDYYTEFFSRANGVSIFIGMIFGLIMLGNVWSVIWPQQKIVLANAVNVVAGGEADPGAAVAGRKGLLASRQNVIFSVPMLWFMVATSHFYVEFADGGFDNTDLSAGKAWAFIIIALAITAVLELNALGIIGGTGPGPLKWPYESHKNAIITAFVLWAVLWILSEILLQV